MKRLMTCLIGLTPALAWGHPGHDTVFVGGIFDHPNVYLFVGLPIGVSLAITLSLVLYRRYRKTIGNIQLQSLIKAHELNS